MEEDDTPGTDGSLQIKSSESTLTKVAFMAGLTMVSMFSGFSLNLLVLGRRHKGEINANPIKFEDPVRLACRALAWGTLFSFVGVGTITTTLVCLWKL